jgi:hypothetical protein
MKHTYNKIQKLHCYFWTIIKFFRIVADDIIAFESNIVIEKQLLPVENIMLYYYYRQNEYYFYKIIKRNEIVVGKLSCTPQFPHFILIHKSTHGRNFWD